jgi:hypothetical protein
MEMILSSLLMPVLFLMGRLIGEEIKKHPSADQIK